MWVSVYVMWVVNGCFPSLASFPYSGEDPFIIEKYPHVYFAGNQPRFQTKTIEGVPINLY